MEYHAMVLPSSERIVLLFDRVWYRSVGCCLYCQYLAGGPDDVFCVDQ